MTLVIEKIEHARCWIFRKKCFKQIGAAHLLMHQHMQQGVVVKRKTPLPSRARHNGALAIEQAVNNGIAVALYVHESITGRGFGLSACGTDEDHPPLTYRELVTAHGNTPLLGMQNVEVGKIVKHAQVLSRGLFVNLFVPHLGRKHRVFNQSFAFAER